MEIINKSNDVKIVLFVLAGLAMFLLLGFLLCKAKFPKNNSSETLVGATTVFLLSFATVLVLDLNGYMTKNTVKITEPEYIQVCVSDNTKIKETGDGYIIVEKTDFEIEEMKEKAAKNKLHEKYIKEECNTENRCNCTCGYVG